VVAFPHYRRGSMTMTDLQRHVEFLDKNMTVTDLQRHVEFFDKNKDGVITLTESTQGTCVIVSLLLVLGLQNAT
jgi:Ca2+-binding EF-hand superfamily protein